MRTLRLRLDPRSDPVGLTRGVSHPGSDRSVLPGLQNVRVLVVSPDPLHATGGGSLIAERLAESLPVAWYHLRPDRGAGLSLVGEGLVPRSLVTSYLPPGLRLRKEIARRIAEFRPDILHAHGFGHPVVNYAIREARKAGVSVIWTTHGLAKAPGSGRAVKAAVGAYNAWSSRLATHVCALTAPTAAAAAEVEELTGRRVCTIPWGPPALPLAPRAITGDPVMLAVGRVIPLRRLELLIEAAAIVRRTHPAAQLRIVGPVASDKYGRRLRGMAQQFGHPADVLYGESDAQGVVSHLLEASVFVSLASQESFGLASMEAVMCGVPVVLTNVGVAPELLGTESPSLISVDTTPTQIAQAILSVLGDPRGARDAARQRSVRLRAELSWQQTVINYEKVLQRCVWPS